MQILKSTVKENILHAAMGEFEEKGYEKTSMRLIAKNAGITAGNMYRYFGNKECLFTAVVKPSHERLMDLLQYDAIANKKARPEKNIAEEIAVLITELFDAHRRELLILLSKSSGSRYENYKQDLIEMVKRRITDTLMVHFSKNGIQHEDEVLALAMASSLIEGLIVVLKECVDKTIIRKLSGKIIEFHFKDMLSIYPVI